MYERGKSNENNTERNQEAAVSFQQSVNEASGEKNSKWAVLTLSLLENIVAVIGNANSFGHSFKKPFLYITMPNAALSLGAQWQRKQTLTGLLVKERHINQIIIQINT